MQNLGIIGRARSGKDTAGAWFVETHGYERVSFADPIREAALKLNPWVDYEIGSSWELKDVGVFRLADVVTRWGWEEAKSRFPESRRILQEYGMTIRALDPDFWIRAAMRTAMTANALGTPAVITDVRFPNEVDSLKRAGFKLLHIDRPGIAHLDHESEGAVGPEDAHYLARNGGTLAALYEQLDHIWDDIDGLNRARRLMLR